MKNRIFGMLLAAGLGMALVVGGAAIAGDEDALAFSNDDGGPAKAKDGGDKGKDGDKGKEGDKGKGGEKGKGKGKGGEKGKGKGKGGEDKGKGKGGDDKGGGKGGKGKDE